MLQSHISKNVPSQQLAVGYTLQNMNILSETITAEDHPTNVPVDSHITAIVNATDYTIVADIIYYADKTDLAYHEWVMIKENMNSYPDTNTIYVMSPHFTRSTWWS